MTRIAERSPGFTIVELMVTVAVFAVLAALAVPSFTDFFDRSRVRGAGDEVLSLIATARAEAVENDLDVTLAFVDDGTNPWCIGANSADAPLAGAPAAAAAPCDCTTVDACMVADQQMVMTSADYEDVDIGALPAAMTFDSMLGAVVPLGTRTVTLTSPSGKYDLQVQVNGLGQARLCTPDGKPGMSGVARC